MGMFKFSFEKATVHALVLSLYSLPAAADLASWQWNVFSHADSVISSDDLSNDDDDVELGESSLFITGNVSSRISFLFEATYQPDRYRSDTTRLERMRLRYDINEHYYAILGKIHTPMNYWNDTFHHGRLFFPTISRPLALDRFMPIHEIAVRVGAKNLGDYNAFYDVVIGSGQNATAEDEIFGNGIKSYTFNVGFKPLPDWTLQTAYYKDNYEEEGFFHSHGDDDHHSDMGMAMGPEVEDIGYELLAASSNFEQGNWRLLTELSANRNDESDDENYSIYQYVGYQLSDDLTGYLYLDQTDVAKGDVFFTDGTERRWGVGLNWFFAATASLKTELIEHEYDLANRDEKGVELRFQLAVSF